MEGILEQILSELKSIKELLKNNNLNSESIIVDNNEFKNTMKLKEAAKYIQISEYRLRLFAIQGNIKSFKSGNKWLFRKSSLDEWLNEIQEQSLKKENIENKNQYGILRKIKE